MALGYCPICDKLVPITPGLFKNNGTTPPQRYWIPVEHESNGKLCKGKAI